MIAELRSIDPGLRFVPGNQLFVGDFVKMNSVVLEILDHIFSNDHRNGINLLLN